MWDNDYNDFEMLWIIGFIVVIVIGVWVYMGVHQ